MWTPLNEKILHKGLFHVEGALVDAYNRSLSKIIGEQTKLDSFRVDMRGESPEIEEELGQNYLQNGPSNRYAIVVSPEQRNAGLLHEEFSYDQLILRKIYDNHTSEIGLVNRVDSLFGEFQNGIHIFDAPIDLLRLKSVNVHLKTPSDFISFARTQQTLLNQLRENPYSLKDVASEILESFATVGDVRNYSLASIMASHDIESFSTRLFDGVYVFRENPVNVPVEVHRPSNYNQMQRLREQIYGSNKKKKNLRKILRKLEKISERASPIQPYTTVYCDAGHNFDSADFVNVISTPGEAVDFLLRSKYVTLDKNRITASKTQIEDLTLLERGYDVADMSAHERSRAISKEYKEFPRSWKYLHDTLSNEAAGYSIDGLLKDADVQIQSLLLASSPGSQQDVVNRLLARLNQVDLVQQARFAPRDLENRFNEGNEALQNYIIQTLR